MPIRYVGNGDLTDSSADAIVITVNCVGVMGKGLALDFKRKFPKSAQRYEQLCKQSRIHTGVPFVCRNADRSDPDEPALVIYAPTKGHWKWPSKMEWIESICEGLGGLIERTSIKRIAVPPLGCGNGGLNWVEVRALIETHLGGLDECEVLVYGEVP